MMKRLVLASGMALAAWSASSGPGAATDLEAVVTDQQQTASIDQSSQFVRIGLNKSIVVRLPAEARDVIVGDPNTVDAIVRRKNVAYVIAKGVGQSNIFFLDANGEQILNLDVEVTLDSLALKKLMQRAIPGTRITVDTVNKDVVLGGTAANAQEAKQALDLAQQFNGQDGKVINTMRVAGEDQVMLKVKVVEIQRDVLKQMGVDLQAALASGEQIFNFASINPFQLSQAVTSAGAGDAVTDNTGDFRFSRIMRALENDGLARTLAEPNLTAVTGQAAHFHAGGEIPFSVCSVSDGVRSCEVNFKEYGVNLDFTPTVMTSGRINLKLKSEVSDLSSLTVGGIPAIDSRVTETVLEMPSGGSMMIAGLIKETTRQNLNGMPGLKRLPILGALFRSREFQANQTELVVLVTPYLVKPVATSKLQAPDKNFNPATDRQSLFFGKLHKTYGSSGKAPANAYNGNVGFIVE